MRRLRVLVLLHEDLFPPDEIPSYEEWEFAEWKTEFDVRKSLIEAGHQVQLLGVSEDLRVIREAIDEFRPHIIFNLLEEFAGRATFDQHVVSYLEMLGVKYTGCNPRGLMISRSKDLAKKLLTYHRIPNPQFHVFTVSKKVLIPKRIQYPLFVKSLTEEASTGITQDSIVFSDKELRERIHYFAEKVGSDVIAESYIEGREFYVSILGNDRLTTMAPWELFFNNLPDRVPRVATRKVKWDSRYRKKYGIDAGLAKDLDQGTIERIQQTAKRTYKALGLSGYARIDLRMDDQGGVFVIEANPNPDIGLGDEFAESAKIMGYDHPKLMDRILSLGLSWSPPGT
ncbi:MAG: ATP-grasp domain-containing protein [Bdellovibrionaceae bacterium]|nr:ATP-grasp domain-containing protein [Bdellovibrionales bacterium]MCB9086074.1 ATP-grasp domain-containing protein [Pseudobdellovibrionaceae bacterium]